MTEPYPWPNLGKVSEVFLAFFCLGLTSFGGPIAHLGYFRRAFVHRRHWLNEDEYADMIALSQFLPGPTSSQTGFLIGLRRAGLWGGFAAWAGFTSPSALLMLGFAVLAPNMSGPFALSAIHGLKLVAVAVVAQAVWSMATKLCTDRRRAAIALGAFLIILLVASPFMQLASVVAGALAGLLLCRNLPNGTEDKVHRPIRKRVGVIAGLIFAILLAGLTIAGHNYPGHSPWALANIFYRAGTLVFGGGHVVLPVLREALIPAGWINDDTFLAGYGVAQAMPGPLFTFATYLGGRVVSPWGAIPTALLTTVMIFLPGMLLVVAIYPFWSRLRGSLLAGAALSGVNAAVVGILAAALYNPVWTSSIAGPGDVAIVATGLLLLEKWRAPPLVVVIISVLGSTLLSLVTT